MDSTTVLGWKPNMCETDGILVRIEEDEIPLCPVCEQEISMSMNGSNEWDIQLDWRRYRDFKVVRESVVVKIDCYRVTHVSCGLQLLVTKKRELAFMCDACLSFRRWVSTNNRGLTCILEQRGMNDPFLKMESLMEAEVYIPPSRREFLDGFIKGVIQGEEICLTDHEGINWSEPSSLRHLSNETSYSEPLTESKPELDAPKVRRRLS